MMRDRATAAQKWLLAAGAAVANLLVFRVIAPPLVMAPSDGVQLVGVLLMVATTAIDAIVLTTLFDDRS